MRATKPEDSVHWRVVEIAPDGLSARLAPYLGLETLARLLDATFGAAGWANRFLPFSDRAVVGELEIEGVVKASVVQGVPAAGGPEGWAAAALTKAAALHGLELPVDPSSEAWVDWDDAAGEPRWWPDHEADAVPTGLAPAANEATPRPEQRTGPHPEPHLEQREPDGSTPAAAAPIKSEGQQAIDKLMDRLRDAGRGLAAAKLVTEHQGYGTDPDEARALYARLRQLLLDGATS